MHDIAFDGIHDEIVVTSPLTQAILSFRGAASGEEAPLRVIQGDKTQIKGVGATGKVSIDPVHNEIYLATPDQTILVFNRTDNGNVAPKRVLGGPHTQLSLGKQNTDNTVVGERRKRLRRRQRSLHPHRPHPQSAFGAFRGPSMRKRQERPDL